MGFLGSAENCNSGAGSRARASPRGAAEGERLGGRGSGGRAAVTARTVIGRVRLFPSGSAKVTGHKAAQLYLIGVSVEFLQGRLQLSLTVGGVPRCGLACVPLSFGPCCAQRSSWTWWRQLWGPGARWPGGPLAGAGPSGSPEVGGQQNNPAGVLRTQTPGHLLTWLCGRPGRGALATCAPGGSDDAVTPGWRPVRRRKAALGPAAGGSALHQGRLVLW